MDDILHVDIAVLDDSLYVQRVAGDVDIAAKRHDAHPTIRGRTIAHTTIKLERDIKKENDRGEFEFSQFTIEGKEPKKTEENKVNERTTKRDNIEKIIISSTMTKMINKTKLKIEKENNTKEQNGKERKESSPEKKKKRTKITEKAKEESFSVISYEF